ncbi:MAG TPA: helix-turn-helix domain-containing protein [Anaerovoracaceae bacterium]|nr:helix-turn-helix domain-containing protein [Anaerovoracaceae bacterium]
MKHNEFTYKLSKLPPDTPLTIGHVLGLLESLGVFNDSPKEVPQAVSGKEEKYLTEDELSEYIRIPVSTLQKWRGKMGKGPGFQKYQNGSVTYRLSDVNAWLEHITVDNTTESFSRLGAKRLASGFDLPVPLIYVDNDPTPQPFFHTLGVDPEKIVGYVLESVDFYESPEENLPAWLYNQFDNPFLHDLMHQLNEVIGKGGNINQIARRKLGEEIIEFTVADLVAHYTGMDESYQPFVMNLMNLGLDVSHVQDPSDEFKAVLNTYTLYTNLKGSLASRG